MTLSDLACRLIGFGLGTVPMSHYCSRLGIDDVIDSRIPSIFVLSTRHMAKPDSIIYPTYYRIQVIIENLIFEASIHQRICPRQNQL